MRHLTRRRMLALLAAAPLPWVAGCSDSKPKSPSATDAGTPRLGAGQASTPSPSASPSASTGAGVASAPAASVSTTPISCSGAPTPSQTEGPYFTAGSPQRTSLLEPGMVGTRLLLTGLVLTRGCKPVANAKLDFWQADAAGAYDNKGYRLRGHQFTDTQGRYSLETIVPGEYPGRTEHIHVKVQAPGAAVLTSQLYFPGVARNASAASSTRPS